MDMIRKSETEIESFLRKTKSTLNARMRCNELCDFFKIDILHKTIHFNNSLR